MVRLEYKSLVTKEIIDYYLSILKDENQKKDFLNTVSKFDIRISTKPVIRGDEFYCKIWILKRGTKKKAHIKEYYPLDLLDKKFSASYSAPYFTHCLTLSEILTMIQSNADVPDDFEEYCEIHFKDPGDAICRIDYLDDLRRSKRFKKFITQEEIRSFPCLFDKKDYANNQEQNEDETTKIFDLKDESNLKSLGYSFIFLDDKKEYDKLAELKQTLEYHSKIVEFYGYNPYTGDFDTKKFPVTREDTQREAIVKDFKDFDHALSEYGDYLKYLIKKYTIKQTGNTSKRLAFTVKKEADTLKHDRKFITIVIDSTYFPVQ